MTHIITSLCLRDGACVEVCPVECIVPGQPESDWPWYFIDPDTCIDCGACIPECPYEAIFIEEEVPSDYVADGQQEVIPFDTKQRFTPAEGTVRIPRHKTGGFLFAALSYGRAPCRFSYSRCGCYLI
jgi:ferredoxin